MPMSVQVGHSPADLDILGDAPPPSTQSPDGPLRAGNDDGGAFSFLRH